MSAEKRGPGRPPVEPDKRRTKGDITMAPDAWEKLKTMAEEQGITQGRVIEALIEKEIDMSNLTVKAVYFYDSRAQLDGDRPVRQAADVALYTIKGMSDCFIREQVAPCRAWEVKNGIATEINKEIDMISPFDNSPQANWGRQYRQLNDELQAAHTALSHMSRIEGEYITDIPKPNNSANAKALRKKIASLETAIAALDSIPAR